MLIFKNNENPLTLGVEMELQVLDKDTLRLTPKAPDIIEMVNSAKLSKEMFRSTLEIITGVCQNVHEVMLDFHDSMAIVNEVAIKLGVRFAGTGTNPIEDFRQRILSASQRYHELLDRNQWLIRRMAVYGLHVHIGMRNAEECILFNNFFLRFVPHLIALSGSSPFWRGYDTGLISSRPTMYESHPTAGMPHIAKNWKGFEEMYDAMIQTGAIQSMKDIWWDIRPSPNYGTLELRMCDGTATLSELASIVCFVHLLAHWFDDHKELYYETHALTPETWILRENKWRAIRFGTEARLIDCETFESQLMETVMKDWLAELHPYIEKLGYEPYIPVLLNILEKGNSSVRQKDILSIATDKIEETDKSVIVLESEHLLKVVAFNVEEFEKGEPIWLI